jgi:hypothetical protein
LMPLHYLVQTVISFYAGSGFGGGQFYYDPTVSETLHDGGRILAKSAVDAFNIDGGDYDAVDAFTDFAGAGAGCYIRINQGYTLPEVYGAVGDYNLHNDTKQLQACHENQNGRLKLQKGKVYGITKLTSSDPLLIEGEGELRCIAATDIAVDCASDLKVRDAKVSDPSGNVTRSFFWSTTKQPKFYRMKIGSVPNAVVATANASKTVGVKSYGALGRFVASEVEVEGQCRDLFELTGTVNWDKRNNKEATAIISDCDLKATDYLYSLKGFNHVKVVDNECRDWNHATLKKELYSQDTGLSSDWAVSVGTVTIANNGFTTTVGTTGIIATVLTVGQTYRFTMDIVAPNGGINVYNGTSSGTLLLSGVGTGHHIVEFTATDARLFVRSNTAQTVTFEKAQTLRKPGTDTGRMAFVSDCMDLITNDNVWYGGDRGPTAGIDTFGVSIQDNRIYDAWDKAVAVDTERFSPPAWDSKNPVSRAKVSGNSAYDCGRFIYSTCRMIEVTDNFMSACAPTTDSTRPGAMRFNSEDFAGDEADVFISRNRSIKHGANPMVTFFKGTIRLGHNETDSTSANPYISDDNTGRIIVDTGSNIKAPNTTAFSLHPLMKMEVVQYATVGTFLEITVPSAQAISMLGAEITVVFQGTVGDIRFNRFSGLASINGGSTLAVPVGTKFAKLVCFTNSNDCYVTFHT